MSKNTSLSLKMGPIGSPKTSVSNHLAPRYNPEDGRIPISVVTIFLLAVSACRHKLLHLYSLVPNNF
jgi:hypothetical protein